jgi:hypothetical protein
MLVAMAPRNLPRLNGVDMDPVVLTFAALAGVVTALVCGLMLRSVLALGRVNPGYDPTNVLTFFVQPQAQLPPQRAAFMRQVRERLLAIPGVVGATAATPLPLDGITVNGRWGTEAAVSDPSAFRQADFRFILPGYFETLRTPLIAGRVFTDADDNYDGPNPPKQLIIDDVWRHGGVLRHDRGGRVADSRPPRVAAESARRHQGRVATHSSAHTSSIPRGPAGCQPASRFSSHLRRSGVAQAPEQCRIL